MNKLRTSMPPWKPGATGVTRTAMAEVFGGKTATKFSLPGVTLPEGLSEPPATKTRKVKRKK